MNTCPKCGKEIKANEKFCTSCGTPIVRCPKCGTPYLPGRKFCTACGAPLQAEDTPGMGKVRQTNVSPGGAAVSGQHKRNPGTRQIRSRFRLCRPQMYSRQKSTA